MILKNDLKTPEERVAYVTQICETTPQEELTPQVLLALSDYIIEAIPKAEKLKHTIITKNRQKHINRRETSYQGTADKLEGGEDAMFNIITDSGPEQYLDHKEDEPFTQALLDSSPELRELQANISSIEAQIPDATGRRKFLLKRQVIEMRQEQYVIRASLIQPVRCTSVTRAFAHLDLSENITVQPDGTLITDGICSLYNPRHVAAILHNYEALLLQSKGKFNSDSWYFMMDFKKLFEKDYAAAAPMYFDIAMLKINGYSNTQIQAEIRNKYNVLHSLEYISTLWTTKIPAAIADLAVAQYLDWYYLNQAKGRYKKCNRCGQIKLALPRYFSKNASSKDGFYSICKECRNKKGK